MKSLPNRGHIGIFNRSYYEEVLAVRVHPEFLAKQRVPPQLVGKRDLVGAFRRHPQFRTISRARGVVVRKFFFMCQRKNRSGGSSSESTTQKRIGSSPRTTRRSVTTGTTT